MDSEAKIGRSAFIAMIVYVLVLGLAVTPSAMLHKQAGLQVPFTGLMFLGFLPIPLTVFHVLRVRWLSVVMALAASVFLFMAGNSILFSVLAGLGIYFISLAMAESLQSPGYPYPAMVVGTLVLVMLGLVLLAMFHWGGIDIFGTFQSYLQHMALQNLSVPKDAAKQSVNVFMDRLRLITPGLLCITAFLESALVLLFCRAILGKGRVQMPPLLLTWRLPQSTVVIYVIALTFVLFGWGKDNPFWWQALNNIAYLAAFFIGIQGIAFIWRRMQHIHGKSAILTFMIIALGIRLVGIIYIMFGLMDLMNRTRRT